jgi:hypothetical protein
MKIYLDDDSAAAVLVRLLLADGHDVVTPVQVGNVGKRDPAHFLYALRDGRAILTRNYRDFELLHELVIGSGGHHAGVLADRRDNNPKRDLTYKQLVRALRNLIKSGIPVADDLIILNHWR